MYEGDNILWDFIIGILSSVATAILITMWQRLLKTAPARSFWKLDPVEGVSVTISLAEVVNERRFYVPTGDVLALNQIVMLLQRVYPGLKVNIHRDARRPLSDWEKTIILIGGGKNNITTRYLLAALDPPMHGRDLENPPTYDSKGLRCRKDRQVYLRPEYKDGLVSMDYGYVIRTVNPFCPSKYVFVIVGGHTHGTQGAALWATRSKNLAWLELNFFWRRLTEMVGRHTMADSVEVVLRVPAVGRLSEADIPLVGDVQVWNHKGGKRPYYFRTPPKYSEVYSKILHTYDERKANSGEPERPV